MSAVELWGCVAQITRPDRARPPAPPLTSWLCRRRSDYKSQHPRRRGRAQGLRLGVPIPIDTVHTARGSPAAASSSVAGVSAAWRGSPPHTHNSHFPIPALLYRGRGGRHGGSEEAGAVYMLQSPLLTSSFISWLDVHIRSVPAAAHPLRRVPLLRVTCASPETPQCSDRSAIAW